MAKRKTNKCAGLHPRPYPLMCEAAETGATIGVRRAFKHGDETISEEKMDYLVECVANAIMTEICERFDFDPEEDGL